MNIYHVYFALVIFFVCAESQVIFNKDGTYTCTHPNDSTCGGPGIFRCKNGKGQATFCDHVVAGLTPQNQQTTSCWEDSEPGNAYCVADCVSVKAVNGTVVYPAGCTYQKFNVTGAPSSISLDRPTSTLIQDIPASTATTTAVVAAQVSMAAAPASDRTIRELYVAGIGLILFFS